MEMREVDKQTPENGPRLGNGQDESESSKGQVKEAQQLRSERGVQGRAQGNTVSERIGNALAAGGWRGRRKGRGKGKAMEADRGEKEKHDGGPGGEVKEASRTMGISAQKCSERGEKGKE